METAQLKLRGEVAALYEGHPYPPVGYLSPFFQRIRWEERPTLNYRAAYAASFGSTEGAKAKPRILVAGCGTFEPVVIALANPGAEILAVDLSARSLRRLEWQARLRGLRKQISTWNGSLEEIPESFGTFDFVIATGVIHHLTDPARGLSALVASTAPRAVFRFMAYSYWGRSLLYGAKELAGKLGADSPSALRKLMDSLPANHPYKIYFHLYSDARTDSGLCDGYLHPCDHPFLAFELRDLLLAAGLRASRFLHGPEGQPEAADQLAGPAAGLWERVALLDCYGELQENFRFFACRSLEQGTKGDAFEWNEALPARGPLHSHLLGKSLAFDRSLNPDELPEENRAELVKALYLLPKEPE